ncbi:hypothetical protein SORBI_3001G367500 [Sorghum bicolor]|uniref:Uncharacterized protein n=1 Tax=Sorghum bicolor TaxID=4558 RepID=A0A1Z5SA14_SORBI|nr:hypothetical protein SORBI_3001G367500 [Sorghum bicolor]
MTTCTCHSTTDQEDKNRTWTSYDCRLRQAGSLRRLPRSRSLRRIVVPSLCRSASPPYALPRRWWRWGFPQGHPRCSVSPGSPDNLPCGGFCSSTCAAEKHELVSSSIVGVPDSSLAIGSWGSGGILVVSLLFAFRQSGSAGLPSFPAQFGMLIQYLFEKFPNWQEIASHAIVDLQVSQTYTRMEPCREKRCL